MKPEYYLLSYKVSGIKNIEKEIKLEFYNKTIDKSFDPDKYRIKAVYGENGAGKTAIVSSVKILKQIIMNTSFPGDSTNQKKLRELINKKTKQLKIEVEFTGQLHDSDQVLVYMYCVELSQEENGKYCISHESLYEKSGEYASAKYRPMFICDNGNLSYAKAEGHDLRTITAQTQNLLQDRSLINIFFSNIESGKSFDLNKPLIKALFNTLFFSVRLSVCIEDTDQHDMYFLAEELKAAKEIDDIKDLLNRSIKQVDLLVGGTTRVLKAAYEEYAEEVKKLESFLKLFKRDLLSVEIDKKDNGDYYETTLVMNYGSYTINTEFESTGIKKLIRLFSYMNYAATGGVVFIDEMDSNINDVYLTKLVEFFMEYGEGQLCFTTHNTGPMTVLRRNKKSIDFLSNDNRIISWTTNGNFAPDKLYRQGMIEYLPFNIQPEDFVGILGRTDFEG